MAVGPRGPVSHDIAVPAGRVRFSTTMQVGDVMSEQSDSVLDEAVRLMDGLRRRVVRGAIRGAMTGSGSQDSGDVWSKATSEEQFDHIATGSAECRKCPVCRAIAAARTSGPDVVDYVVDAGESLVAAAREAVSAYDRSRRTDKAAGTTSTTSTTRTASAGGSAGAAPREQGPPPAGPVDIG